MDTLRGHLATIAFIVSLPCSAYLFFFGLVGYPLPPNANFALSAFLGSALSILLVFLAAPVSHRRKAVLWAAAVMLILWITATILLSRDLLLSTFIAAVGVFGFTLWLMPKSGDVKRARQRLPASTVLAAFGTLLAASFFDWPAWPDELPDPLMAVTDGRGGVINKFHRYSLGGFVDSESLWRIDAKPEVLEAIAAKLGMRTANTTPTAFWKMPPYYWPRSLPPGARLYSSPLFPAGAGDSYFMLVDGKRGRGLVWVKSKFG